MAKKWVTEDELNYMKMGGKVVYAQEGMTAQSDEQQQVMQLIQMYAQKAGISPEEIVAQLQQMQPEQAQQAIQQMVQELQSGQGFQKEPQYIQEEQEEMKKGGTVSPEKAKKILKDGTVHGKPLTEKQRKFFGAMASKKAEEGTLVNSLPPSLLAPIEKTKERKNRGTTYEENSPRPFFVRQAGGTVDLYNVNYQNAVQKMIQGGYMTEGGEAKPYFYNMTIPGPEVMGPGNPIFGKGLVFAKDGKNVKPHFYDMTISGPEVMGKGNPIFGTYDGLSFYKEGGYIKPQFYDMTVGGPEVIGPGNPIFGTYAKYGTKAIAEDGWISKIANFFGFGGDEQKAPAPKPEPEPEPEFITIQDTRKIHPVTGKPINPNVDLKTGKYSTANIKNIINAANKLGYDPYTAIAVALQETNIGKTDPQLGHVLYGNPYSDLASAGYSEKEIADIMDKNPTYGQAISMVQSLKSKQQEAIKKGYKTPEYQLQFYNGMGKLTPQTEKGYHKSTGRSTNRFYGVDVTKEPLDLAKNPAYGKTVLSYIPFIKGNKEIENLIKSTRKEEGGQIREPYFYGIDIKGPEVIGPGNPIFGVYTEEGGTIPPKGYHVMPSGKLMSNAEHKKNGSVGPKMKFTKGMLSIQGGQGAKRYAQKGNVVQRVSGAPEYSYSSGYQSYTEPHPDILQKIKESLYPDLGVITTDGEVYYEFDEQGNPTNIKYKSNPKTKISEGSEDYKKAIQIRDEQLDKEARDTYFYNIYQQMQDVPEGYIPPEDFKDLMSNLRKRKAAGENLDYYDDIMHYPNTKDINEYINKFGPYRPSEVVNYLFKNRDKYYNGGYAKYGLNGMLSDGLTTPHDHYAQEGILVGDPTEIALRRAIQDNYNLKQNLGYQTDKFGFNQAIEENPVLKRLMISSGMNFKTNPVRFNVSGQYNRNQDVNTGNVKSSLMFPTKKGEVSFTGGYNRMPDKTNAYNTGVSYSGTTKGGGKLNLGVGVEGERNVPPRGNIDFSFEPFEEGGYITYRPKWGAAPYPTNRADYLAAFAEAGLGVTPWAAKMQWGGYTPFASQLQGPFTQGFKNRNPNEMDYSFAGTSKKDPYLKPFDPSQSQPTLSSSNNSNLGMPKTGNLNLTTGTPAAKEPSAQEDLVKMMNDVNALKQQQLSLGSMPSVGGGNKSQSADQSGRMMANLERKEVSSGLKGGPLGMGLEAAGSAMDATAQLMASLGKEDSKAQAFGQGASNAMQIAGMATAPFKDIPVVGQALDVAGKTLGFLIGGPLAARKQAIENEEKKKQDRLRQYYERTQPGVYATQGQYMAKYGKNVNSMKQRVIDEIYNDFDKYMKLT